MKTLGSKIAYVEKWLKEGKKLSGKQAWINFGYYRLSDAIYKLRKKGMWIIDAGKKDYAEYLLIERGLIKNRLFNGFKLTVIDAKTIFSTSGQYQDMEVYIVGNNGNGSVSFEVRSDAFRSKKVMENKLKEALS